MGLSVFFFEKDGKKVEVKTEDLYITLENGQVLTISKSHNSSGIAISDHTFGELDKEYALLSITPGACNVIIVDSKKEIIKNSSADHLE